MPAGQNKGIVNENHISKKLKIIEYLTNPANEWLNRKELASMLNISAQSLYKIFTPTQLKEIEMEALKARRATYAPALAKVDNALLKKAQEGDVAAIKLSYQRFEEWFESKMTRLADPDGEPLNFVMNIGGVDEEI